MGTSIGAALLALAFSMSQVAGEIDQEDRDFQNKVFQQWWGKDIVWKFDALPTDGKVAEKRIPYSGYIYPDTSGGTISALRKYDLAFHQGRLLATDHERRDTSLTEQVTRQVTERFGLFGGQIRTYNIVTNATPAWYGHCNGWTSAAIRHAEPQKSVTRNGIVFTPADIKGLLAEIYLYNDPQMLAGDGEEINPGVLHAILTNWLGAGSHPIGMDSDPGKEKWNYPIHAYSTRTAQYDPNFVDVAMNITYAMSSRGEFDASPRIPATKYFHYRLSLNDAGEIVGGLYYRDSSRIDMLWVPLRPKPSGKEGNERGNPHVDVEEVLAIWRSSVPDNLRRNWVIIDPPNSNPRITSAKSSTVSENQSQVLQVTASDQDLEEGLSFVASQQLTFAVTGGADQAAFAIDENTGELTFTAAPDFEQPTDNNQDNQYEVEVSVNDGAGGRAAHKMRIVVTDTNDAPTILSGPRLQTMENQTAAIAVAFEDQDRPAQGVTCSLSGGADLERFSIDPESGVLKFIQNPNYEKPLDADEDNVYELEVTVSDDEGAATSQLVQIVVTDANDPPVILSSNSQRAAENQLTVFKLKYEDEDESRQSLSCSLTGGSDLDRFTINSKTGELSFKSMPDFEDPADLDLDNIYEVEVCATDDAAASVRQLVSVTVTDVNDAPVITSTNSPITKENELAVLTISHRDEDKPPQSITYSLVGGTDHELFSIDELKGLLTFNALPNFEKPLDADRDNRYEVEVGVRDSAGGISSQLLCVSVTDTNDAPIITSNKTMKLAENGTSSVAISATDEDLPLQRLAFSLCGGGDCQRFAIDAKSGELKFKRAPDFENPADANKDNNYEVEVRVEDADGGAVTQFVQVSVVDANDPPVIVTKGQIEVPEGESIAALIVARDEDQIPQKLTYSLRGGADRKRFSVNATTGELTFVQVPDFEHAGDADKDNIYAVRVRVDDGAGGIAMEMLRITVADVNEPPVITSSDTVEAIENQVFAFTILCTDQDIPAQRFTYKIVGGDDRERFAVDSGTGDTIFLKSPDFENPCDANRDNVYEVELEAEDNQGGRTSRLFQVTVINANEHPTITYSPKVQENQIEVLTVNVSDEDMSTREITISISGGSDRDIFNIDSRTGDLSFKTAPDFENPTDSNQDNIYEVEVKVEDGDGGSALKSIRVKVLDVDEVPSKPESSGGEDKPETAAKDEAEPPAPQTQD
ncbi:MAG: cadherin domain-containing protein [Planctomycetaceae bacterium]|nr:cadherin domain-containing protein [Planctomycetales bacterium]MCB9922967.1 cadherin domain-containing protein [Planctomycetaceae bacterium]